MNKRADSYFHIWHTRHGFDMQVTHRINGKLVRRNYPIISPKAASTMIMRLSQLGGKIFASTTTVNSLGLHFEYRK